MGRDSAAPEDGVDKKNDEAEEDFPTLSPEELDLLDPTQKDEYQTIQKDYQRAKQLITEKKGAITNAKKALDAAKRIQTTAKDNKRRRGDDGAGRPAGGAAGSTAAVEVPSPPEDHAAGPEVQLANKYYLTNEDQVAEYLTQLAKLKNRAKVAVANRQAPAAAQPAQVDRPTG